MEKTIVTNRFYNVISLGFFCSIAIDLEKMGLRSFSGPFDWIISDSFEDVIELIQNSFAGFIEEGLLEQNIDNPYLYRNKEKEIRFYHDFDGYISLDKQFVEVKEKFDRRIKRFYEEIKKPTLFIRYISDLRDVDYIVNNYKNIIKALKCFNEQNELLIISQIQDEGLSRIPLVFYVKKDEGDSVNRNPLFSNKELTELLNGITNINRDKNKAFAKNKKKRKYSIKRFFCRPYRHCKRF